MLSRRATQIFAKPSAIFAAHQVCHADPYHPVTNPGGYVNLGTAENRLVWDLLGPRLAEAAATCHEADAHYSTTYGLPAFRTALSAYFRRAFGAAVDPEQIVVANGSTALLDMLAFALCEDGEAFLVPAPYYSGFDVDLAGRSHVEIVPAKLSGSDGFRLTHAALAAGMDEAGRRGLRVRALLVASPANPLGRALTGDEVETARRFAAERDLHVIFDEVYAQSCFPGVANASALARLAPRKTHFVYGMSKDFTLAGFRVGVFHTPDPDVLAAMRSLSYFNNASNHTQRLLATVLDDAAWTEHFLSENRRRLAAAFATLARTFAPFGRFATTDAGVFAWLDLGRHLGRPTFEAETALHQRIMRETRVNILPGQAFHCPEPGWFRVCYAHDAHVVETAAARLAPLLGGAP